MQTPVIVAVRLKDGETIHANPANPRDCTTFSSSLLGGIKVHCARTGAVRRLRGKNIAHVAYSTPDGVRWDPLIFRNAPR